MGFSVRTGIGTSSSVVVGDLDLMRITLAPDEAETPPPVDPDAVLPRTIPLECLQAVPRRRGQVSQADSPVQEQEFPSGLPLEGAEGLDIFVPEKTLCPPAPEGPDHGSIL
jgi:hypothetical protein